MEQYTTDTNLAARQRFWNRSRHEPADVELYTWVLDVAGLPPGGTQRVLDVGCGNGVYERALVERRHRGPCVALDVSAGMLQEVRAAGRVQGDAQALPFSNGVFDVVLAPHMLYHVVEMDRAIAECRRVLRPGGTFVATTNGTTNVIEIHELIAVAMEVPRRSSNSSGGFVLETGGPSLEAVFSEVTRVDFPVNRVSVDDADLVAAFVDSMGDFHANLADRPWSGVVDRARLLVKQQIETRGAFTATWSVGAFVCR